MKLQSDSRTEVLDRATVYEFLAAGFRRPRGVFLATLRAPAFLTRVFLATTRLSDDLGRLFNDSRKTLLTHGDAMLAASYARVFPRVITGDCGPRESDYESTTQVVEPHDFASVAEFYATFGLRVAADLDERDDHVGVECEFMGFLCALEAAALLDSGEDYADISRAAQSEFLEKHLGRFMPSLCASVRKLPAAQGAFLASLAALAQTFLEEEVLRVGASTSPATVPLSLVREKKDCCQPFASHAGRTGMCKRASGMESA